MGEVSAVAPSNDARAVMAQHGRSFHWASRWLGPDQAERCARLYAFCRYVDDLVDEGDPEAAIEGLERVRESLRRGTSEEPVVTSFLALGIPPAVAHHFVDGVATDLEPVAFESEGQLLRYAYGVAGTVGLMMCHALEVDDPRALPFAIDLGVAMQLTNIARDVREDAERGRRYLPASWTGAACSAESIRRGHPASLAVCRAAIDRTLDLAETYYRSADAGMRYLPGRARLAILTASRVYEAIGGAIRDQGRAWSQGRAVVGTARKCWLTLRAAARWVVDGSLRRTVAVRHRASLHQSLRSLPGADPAA